MFLDLFRYFWLIFIDLLKDSMFFPCFWVCLINHFFNVFHYFSWIFTVCFNMLHCFSMFFQCSWMCNPSKWVQNLNEPQSTLEHSSKQLDTGLKLSLDGSTDVSIFSEIYSNWPHMFFCRFQWFFQNQFKSRFMYKSRLAVSNNLNGDSK